MSLVRSWDGVWRQLRDLGYLDEGAVDEHGTDFGKGLREAISSLQETKLSKRQIDDISQLIRYVAKCAWAKQVDTTSPALAELLDALRVMNSKPEIVRLALEQFEKELGRK